jgi:prepilin-type N-terminal cleavage/methylation domain-containing protein/prepilin-type processing-associated H-X9-DG protein
MNSPRPLPRPARGFTLIELLTVIAIIGILAAIIIPTVGRVRESARATACKSNLRQIGLAVQIYGNERGFYPPTMAKAGGPSGEAAGQYWVQFLRPYLGSTGNGSNLSEGARSNIAVCPSRVLQPANDAEFFRSTYSAHPRIMPNENDIGTGASSKKLVRMNSIARPTEVILMADGAQQAHGGAYSNLYSLSAADSTTTNASAANDPISTAGDVDPATGGHIRYRHNGDTTNVVFVDGHVGGFKKGTILNRHVHMFY